MVLLLPPALQGPARACCCTCVLQSDLQLPLQTLSVITAVALLAPIAGLGFAYWSYGRLWG